MNKFIEVFSSLSSNGHERPNQFFSINEKLDQPVNLHFNWNDNISNEPIISSKPPETIQYSTKADKVIEKIIEEFDGEILR